MIRQQGTGNERNMTRTENVRRGLIYFPYLDEAELPPVEHAVDGGDGGDRQERQQPQAHDPEGDVHLHPPHLLLVPRVLHVGVHLATRTTLSH